MLHVHRQTVQPPIRHRTSRISKGQTILIGYISYLEADQPKRVKFTNSNILVSRAIPIGTKL